MILHWYPGKPSGPSKALYYQEAEFKGSKFILCVTYHAGAPTYGLTVNKGPAVYYRSEEYGDDAKLTKRVAMAAADEIAAGLQEAV